jgi:GNAT superfamily N-acetyltransferase
VSHDVSVLVDLGAELHAESAYSFLPYDRRTVRELVLGYVDDHETRCGLVATRGELVVGMIGGYLTTYYFCSERLVSDEVLFVRQDRRGGAAAVRLIRGLERWAAARGARELCLGVSTGIRPDRTGRFYEHLGFARVGGIYKRRLAGG